MTSIVRVMFVGHGPSNLPADRVINVFHFTGPNDYNTDEETCRAKVADFYEGSNPTGAISGYLSPWVQRAYELRAYDMSIPKDTRVPTIEMRTLGAPFGTGLPEEVAACITLHGQVPPAANRRRSGRLYIGPLVSAAASDGSSSGPSRPGNLFIADLCAAALRLSVVVGAAPNWCIRSTRPAENYVPIYSGYVDNAWDTQRRRGPDPTAKVTWGAGI